MTRRTAEDQGGLCTGDWVKLISRRGEITVRVLLSDEVHDGEVYVPMQAAEIRAATATGTRRATRRAPPLPRTHHRYGHPTPQLGVQVQRKWERDDYRPPTEPATEESRS